MLKFKDQYTWTLDSYVSCSSGYPRDFSMGLFYLNSYFITFWNTQTSYNKVSLVPFHTLLYTVIVLVIHFSFTRIIKLMKHYYCFSFILLIIVYIYCFKNLYLCSSFSAVHSTFYLGSFIFSLKSLLYSLL